jgi:hypothetical protein
MSRNQFFRMPKLIVSGFLFASGAAFCNLLAEQSTEPVIERLDPPRRAAVLMAMLGLVLTGLVLVACVMIGAHWVRRLARHKPGSGRSRAAESVSQTQRLRDALASVLPEAKTDDTVDLGRSPRDTRIN